MFKPMSSQEAQHEPQGSEIYINLRFPHTVSVQIHHVLQSFIASCRKSQNSTRFYNFSYTFQMFLVFWTFGGQNSRCGDFPWFCACPGPVSTGRHNEQVLFYKGNRDFPWAPILLADSERILIVFSWGPSGEAWGTPRAPQGVSREQHLHKSRFC